MQGGGRGLGFVECCDSSVRRKGSQKSSTPGSGKNEIERQQVTSAGRRVGSLLGWSLAQTGADPFFPLENLAMRFTRNVACGFSLRSILISCALFLPGNVSDADGWNSGTSWRNPIPQHLDSSTLHTEYTHSPR